MNVILRFFFAALYIVSPTIIYADAALSTRLAEAITPCRGVLNSSPQTVREEYIEAQRRTEAGPFYKMLRQQQGAPTQCTIKKDNGTLRLTYVFPQNSRLELQIDPQLELSDLRLTIHGLSRDQALALLQAEERSAYGNEGCGINWKGSPSKEDGASSSERDQVYWGNVCNCQGRIVFRGTAIVGLVLRSVC